MNKKSKIIIALIATVFSTSVFSATNILHNAVSDNNIKKISEILETNATLLTAFDEKGNTPLHKAIIEDKSASLQTFMDYKKVINMQMTNYNGDTPLVFAIKNNKYNTILFILDNGINPFYKDKKEKNSLDYVKIFGDDTTKKIYNDYYERNKDKIKKLQENYKNPLDLSLFEEKPKSKNTTVQDLLISNQNRKGNLIAPNKNVNVKKEAVANKEVYNKEDIIEIKKQIENINIDKGIILGLEDKLKNLEDNNATLKRRLNFKENTGKDYLTQGEENIVGSPYGGIYEQQVMFEKSYDSKFGKNIEDLKGGLFEKYTVVNEDDIKNDIVIDKEKEIDFESYDTKEHIEVLELIDNDSNSVYLIDSKNNLKQKNNIKKSKNSNLTPLIILFLIFLGVAIGLVSFLIKTNKKEKK